VGDEDAGGAALLFSDEPRTMLWKEEAEAGKVEVMVVEGGSSSSWWVGRAAAERGGRGGFKRSRCAPEGQQAAAMGDK
jgi:hypothetical protein